MNIGRLPRQQRKFSVHVESTLRLASGSGFTAGVKYHSLANT